MCHVGAGSLCLRGWWEQLGSAWKSRAQGWRWRGQGRPSWGPRCGTCPPGALLVGHFRPPARDGWRRGGRHPSWTGARGHPLTCWHLLTRGLLPWQWRGCWGANPAVAVDAGSQVAGGGPPDQASLASDPRGGLMPREQVVPLVGPVGASEAQMARAQPGSGRSRCCVCVPVAPRQVRAGRAAGGPRQGVRCPSSGCPRREASGDPPAPESAAEPGGRPWSAGTVWAGVCSAPGPHQPPLLSCGTWGSVLA